MKDNVNTDVGTKLSEATLEARISAFLAATFPAPELSITHQETFTIRLGHTDHEIGSRKTWAGGRADILVKAGKMSNGIEPGPLIGVQKGPLRRHDG